MYGWGKNVDGKLCRWESTISLHKINIMCKFCTPPTWKNVESKCNCWGVASLVPDDPLQRHQKRESLITKNWVNLVIHDYRQRKIKKSSLPPCQTIKILSVGSPSGSSNLQNLVTTFWNYNELQTLICVTKEMVVKIVPEIFRTKTSN